MAGSSSTSSKRANRPPLRRERQDPYRGGAAAFLALVLERSAVLGEGRAGHGHAQAGPLLAGGEERRAQPVEDLAGHAAAGIANLDLRRAAALRQANFDAAAAAGGIERVGDQVEDGLTQPARIGLDLRFSRAPQLDAG